MAQCFGETMRINGTFCYKGFGETGKDPVTGFVVGNKVPEWKDGGLCQIDKSVPAQQKIGTDGQAYAYTYDVFIPKCLDVGLAIGMDMLVTGEDGTSDVFTIRGIDNMNRKYIEIWG